MKEKEKYRKQAAKLLQGDWDLYDFDSHWDSSISPDEAWIKIRKDLDVLVGENLKDQVERIKGEQERIQLKEIKEAESEAESWNDKVIIQSNKEIESYYQPIIRPILKLIQGYTPLAIIRGRGGIGKSLWIQNTLLNQGLQPNIDFVMISGECTEAYLYRLIYENNGKIIYFKDVNKILSGKASINLLKAACESHGGRILTKSNYSKVQDDLPDSFVCKCKFIFDFNHLQNYLKDDFQALSSRGIMIEFTLSNEDIKNIMRKIAVEEWQKEVTQELIKLCEENSIIRLNLRNQHKAFETYKWSEQNKLDWKEELETDMKTNTETRSLLYSLIGNKIIRTAELKKMLLKEGLVNTIRTADNKINIWLYTDEIYKLSIEDKNFLIGINPKE